MESNETFKVATLFPCNTIGNRSIDNQNTLWRQTLLGCKIIQLMQEVYGFNVSYVYQQEDPLRDLPTEIELYLNSSSVDLYVRPMSLRVDVLELARPVGAIFDWNFGFTVISQPVVSWRDFYSKPFTRKVWNILYGMAIFCSTFFYLLKRWENKVKTDGRIFECSYGYELLMVVGAYCQHIPPIEARLLSRRTAYLVFFFFAYIIYTYYTSNLLSHLVNDKNFEIELEELVTSDTECLIVSNVKGIIDNNLYTSQMASIYRGDNISNTFQKLMTLKTVSIEEGLHAVKNNKTALLSDYVSIAPYIHRVFTSNEICNLAQIDVLSNQKYIFVSKTFPYTEQFKVSLLRIKEAGLLKHLVTKFYDNGGVEECTPVTHVQTQLRQILYQLELLFGTYVLCLIILGIEIWYFRRSRVWPYVN